MKSLFSSQINVSEELINRTLKEFAEGTEYEAQFQLILEGSDEVTIKMTKPYKGIDEIRVRIEEINHNQIETKIRVSVGDVATKNISLKALIMLGKSRFVSGIVEMIGCTRLPRGVNLTVNGEKIQLEVRKWLQTTKVGELEFPVAGRLIDTVEIASVRINRGEAFVIMRMVG